MKDRLVSIRSLVIKMDIDANEAMDLLSIPDNEKAECLALLKEQGEFRK